MTRAAVTRRMSHASSRQGEQLRRRRVLSPQQSGQRSLRAAVHSPSITRTKQLIYIGIRSTVNLSRWDTIHRDTISMACGDEAS
ncbi:hypothetical protein MTO96_002682 [Rhipicephalus appendiculatus]